MTPVAELSRHIFLRDRRSVLQLGAVAAAGALGGMSAEPILQAAENLQVQQKPQERLLGEIFGMGDSPVNGGGVDIDLAIKDLKALHARDVKLIDPRNEMLQAVLENGFMPNFRTYMMSDEIQWDLVNRQIEQIKKFGLKGAFVQWYCEPNNMGELTDPNHPISPERHIEEFFWPVAKHAAEQGVRSVLTPSDQMQGNDKEFFERQIKQLVRMGASLDWLQRNILIGVHVYTLGPNDNPWDRFMQLDAMVKKALGQTNHGMKYVISEIGRFRHRTYAKVAEGEFSQDTLAIFARPIPEGIDIEAVCAWIGANFDQRRKEDRNPPESSVVHDFELQAWRSSQIPGGVRPVYNDWRRFYDEKIAPRTKK